MAYELAGARILSPVVGSSTYVWTSIIGVIIAALSAGYFLGGWLADKRGKEADLVVLLLGCAVGVLLTLLLSDMVLDSLVSTKLDVRLQALAGSLILFAPTSLLLGTLSPYLAKLHTSSLGETGRSVATLSALNSLGGIIGTFAVGFIFFSFIGSRETLVVLIMLLTLSSLLLITKDMLKLQLKTFAVLAGLSFLGLLAGGLNQGVVARLETPTSAYQVRDITYGGRPVRVLVMGPGGYQSGIFLDGSKELVFGYTKAMARGVALHQSPQNILILGGGTFTMPEYFAREYPDAQIDVVEIDPKLKDIAVEYFSYSDPENVTIFAEDARTYVNNTERRYDAILIDAFSDTGIPFAVTTSEFANEVASILKPDGVLLMNVIAGENQHCQVLLRSIYGSFASQLTGKASAVQNGSLHPRQNIILSFTKENRGWLDAYGGTALPLDNKINLTDNYAPIERLHQNCLEA